MNTVKTQPFLRDWSRLREVMAIALFGFIPLTIGKILRHQIYRHLFAKMGTAVNIKSGVHFVQAQSIVLGNQVRIARDVRLNCGDPNGKIVLSDDVSLDQNVDIKAGRNGYINIGKSTYLGAYVCVAGPGSIKIGKDCLIESHSIIYANNHIVSDSTRPIWETGVVHKGIVIEDNCWIGSGVKVLDGVTIGRGSIIGAGSVVTQNIPPNSIAAGIPATVVAKRKNSTSPRASG